MQAINLYYRVEPYTDILPQVNLLQFAQERGFGYKNQVGTHVSHKTGLLRVIPLHDDVQKEELKNKLAQVAVINKINLD